MTSTGPAPRALLSIKPEYAEAILRGTKRYEYRRSVFRREGVRTAVVYATMPVGLVVGEFEIDGVVAGAPADVWAETHEHAGITRAFFDAYFAGRGVAHAIRVARPVRYDPPTTLGALGVLAAPQSFLYLAAAQASTTS